MPIVTTDLMRALADFHLVEPAQAEQIAAHLQPLFPEARALAGELIRRDWLTPYQANHLLQGRGRELLLGSYVLLERLGEGGMGQVFRARNWKLGRVVALKVIRKERLANEEAVRRFHREIQACARLNHPNIVHALDAEEAAGHHFLVMEHVEGSDLGRLVKEGGPLPPALACDCASQAALALQHAHERGLVHRDVKPSNLLRAHKDGMVKLLDLGLARLAQELEVEGSTLTQQGALMGTPDFMAPEQAEESHAVDIRADLYSLGCTLYYLLAGRVPFPGGSYAQKLRKHERAEPQPLESLRPDLPPELPALVRRLMAKRPADRFATPAEAAAALAAVAATLESRLQAVGERRPPEGGTPTPDPPPALVQDTEPPFPEPTPETHRRRRRRRSRRGLMVGVLGLALLGLLFALYFRRRGGTEDQPPDTGRGPPVAEGPQGEMDALRRRLGNREDDARRQLALDLLAFRRRHGATPQALQAADLLRRLPSPLDHLPPIPEAESFPDWQPRDLVAVLGEHRQRHWDVGICVAFHPDGKRVASGGDDKWIRLWDAQTGREMAALRGHANRIAALAFSPDGKTLASADWNNLVFLWDLERPAEPVILRGHAGAVAALAFSPDGRTLASGSWDKVVCLWDVKAPEPRQREAFVAHADQVRALAFSPDGKTLVSGGKDKRVVLWDPATGKERRTLEGAVGEIVAVGFGAGGSIVLGLEEDGMLRRWEARTGRELGPPDGPGSRCLAVSPDGRTAAAGGISDTVTLWDLTTGKSRGALSGIPDGAVINGVAFSPDGKVLATIRHGGDVCFWDLESRRERTPVFGGTPICSLAAAPDGRTLAVGFQDGSLRLWDAPTGEVRVVREAKAGRCLYSVAFRPDGKGLAFGDNSGKVWWVDLAGRDIGPPREVEDLHEGEIHRVAFSPDSRLLAATARAGRVHLWETEAWTARELPPGGWDDSCHVVALGPDGRSLAASFGERENKVRWCRDMRSPDAPLVGEAKGQILGLAFSPDGKTLAAGTYLEVARWEAGTGKPLSSLAGYTYPVRSLSWSPDGRTLAGADCTGRLVWWDAASGKELGRWQAPGMNYNIALIFLPDSRHLAITNANGTVYLLRLPLRAP